MMEEIAEMGYEPKQMIPVFHPVSKTPLPLFFLDLKPSTNNDNIYKLNRLYGAVIKVEPPKPKRNIIQCLRCQDYGHSKNYCHKAPRCVKCEGIHATSQCTKDKHAPPICVNCKGQHTANYRGCPVHLSLQKSSQPVLRNKSERNSANPPDVGSTVTSRTTSGALPAIPYASSAPLETNGEIATTTAHASTATFCHHNSERTYADAVNPKDNANSAFNDSNLIIKLVDKIDSLLSLLHPLINTLLQVLPTLINKK